MNVDESYENVIVTKDIVDFIVSYLTKIYTSNVFKLDKYASDYKSYNEYNDDVTSVTNTSTKNTNNSVINNTEDYLEHVSGKQGTTSYSKLLTEYRDTFLNIDMMVINELNDLFINLW